MCHRIVPEHRLRGEGGQLLRRGGTSVGLFVATACGWLLVAGRHHARAEAEHAADIATRRLPSSPRGGG